MTWLLILRSPSARWLCLGRRLCGRADGDVGSLPKIARSCSFECQTFREMADLVGTVGMDDTSPLFLASPTTPLWRGMGRDRPGSLQHSAPVCLTGRPPSSCPFHFPNRRGADRHHVELSSLVWSHSDVIDLQVWCLHRGRSRRCVLSRA